MRDVTDKVTGELPGVEQKRGRGRPRKAHALTNAERQAAFRARRMADQPVEAKSVTKRMTVTEMLADVDAYDDCRLEVDALRAEVAEWVKRYQDLTDGYHRKCMELAESFEAVALVKGQLRNESRENDELREANAVMLDRLAEFSSKSVTSNGNGPTVDEWIALLALAMKGKTQKARLDLLGHPARVAVYDKAYQLCDRQFDALQSAMLGGKVVTRKA